MKLLLDENLPRSLVEPLSHMFPGSTHVAYLDMLKAQDGELWRVASERGFTIMTKDRDFADRVVLSGPPPKVIWIRIGNCTVSQIEALIESTVPLLTEFADSEFGLLILPSGFRAG